MSAPLGALILLVASDYCLLFVTLAHEQLQSQIMMGSELRIGSKFYIPCAPRARGHVHLPFYEGTCQKLLLGTLPTIEQLQSQITMGSEHQINSNFFCVAPCVSPLCVQPRG